MRYIPVGQLPEHREVIAEALLYEQRSWYFGAPEFQNLLDGIPRGCQILILGCGSGYLSSRLAKQCRRASIVNLDVDDYRVPEAIDFQFIRADLNRDSLQLEDARFDYVFALALLEHLENPFHAVREITRVAKVGGRFVFTIPNGWSFYSRLRFLLRGQIDGYKPNNNHISFLPRVVFDKLFTEWYMEGHFCSRRRRVPLPVIQHLPLPHPRTRAWAEKIGFVMRRRAGD